ncbi:sterol carrier protein domain-containing protein [Chloroflexales bacterium ZM16-3]|nr:sterol carrier protein domain-containing protein [Chloroflexales bacterium ZM16-3]
MPVDLAQDELLPWNNGRFVLRVRDGGGQIERGGQGRLRLDIRDIATLYSGYYTPQELRYAGKIDGDLASLTAAAQIVMGPRPWLPDMF